MTGKDLEGSCRGGIFCLKRLKNATKNSVGKAGNIRDWNQASPENQIQSIIVT
jgi:hypothetical protein